MTRAKLKGVGIILGLGLAAVLARPSAVAHETWEGCADCHGDFRSNNYISLSDGQNWGNLHDLHRSTMLGGDCAACHFDGFSPVILDVSDGGAGFQPIGCVGCHGRNEDMGNDSISAGRGAGLRQHHTNAGVNNCVMCHSDANPDNYTPVGENVLPSYYFTPDAAHPDKPTDPCNPSGEENYAGLSIGLDNDGDDVYDTADSDCADCPNDIDGSGQVDFGDILLVLSTWGTVGGPNDIDGSGMVDFGDLLLVLSTWGTC